MVPAHSSGIDAVRAIMIASNEEVSATHGRHLRRVSKARLTLGLPGQEATVYGMSRHSLRSLFVVVLFLDLSCRQALFEVIDSVLHTLGKQVVGRPLSSFELGEEENNGVVKHAIYLK